MALLSKYLNSGRFSIVKEEEVEVVPLDALYSEKKFCDIDFIKIDT